MDAASPQAGELSPSLAADTPATLPAPAPQPPLPPALLHVLYQAAKAHTLDLTPAEFEQCLRAVGHKYNYGLPSGIAANADQTAAFLHSLQLADLALAQACARGRDAAWRYFVDRFRQPLLQAAIAITRSGSLGQDLADALYSDLFGLSERAGQRTSPLTSYSGRGSFLGWLRTILAQRHIDYHRRTHREQPFPEEQLQNTGFAAPTPEPVPERAVLATLHHALSATLAELDPDDRFLLSAYFLDRRTLQQIAPLLRVHEATVSRKLKRLTASLHQQLLAQLHRSGLSERAAQEALGIDPRDLDVNLRLLLQTSAPAPFSNQKAEPNSEPEV